jgi:hypothetical protein
MDSMRENLRTSVFVCLAAARRISHAELIDSPISHHALKKSINANSRRLDEYSSLLFIALALYVCHTCH